MEIQSKSMFGSYFFFYINSDWINQHSCYEGLSNYYSLL